MTARAKAVVLNISWAENGHLNHQLLGHGPEIQTLGATAIYDCLVHNELVTAFALWIGECIGLLVVTLDSNMLDWPGNTDTSARCDQQGGAAVVVAEETLLGDTWMTATSLLRPKGRDHRAGLGSFVVKLLMTRPPGLLLLLFLFRLCLLLLLHLLILE